MRTLSKVSWIALYIVSPEKPAKSIVTFVASKARSMWGRSPIGRSVLARTKVPLP